MKGKKNHNIDRSKAIRGVERKNHFKAGKTLSAWRGTKSVTLDRRKSQSKNAWHFASGET